MFNRSWIALLAALLMFPQIAETFYSPALADIAQGFSVSPDIAAQTLSCYFLAFAVGVLVWGRLCDRYGRKPILITGLTLYAMASAAALLVSDFSGLLAARILAAFGAAVGSVVTQTVLRDRFTGAELARLFALLGIPLGISPAVGMYAGGVLTAHWGYRGVFLALFALAVILLIWCCRAMPETRPTDLSVPSLGVICRRLARDGKVGCAAVLVALYNISLFSYYSLAPFVFTRLELGPAIFGYTGVALAVGSMMGSHLNHRLLRRGIAPARLLAVAALLSLSGAGGVLYWEDSWRLIVPMLLIMVGFSLAIPLVLGTALSAYGDCRGTAGALFGMGYYLLIGLGLALAGWGQTLGGAQMVCALLTCAATGMYIRCLGRR